MDRISMRRMLSVCAVLLLLVVPLITSCAPKVAEVAEVADPVEKLVFTRTGVALFLEETLDVTRITVVDKTGKSVNTQEVKAKIKQAVVDFEWVPLEKYQFKLDTAEGEFATTAYAPGKPSPLLVGSLELGEVTPTDNAFKLGGCPLPRDPQRSLEISPDGKYVAIGSQVDAVHIVHVADVKTQEELWSQELGEDEISCMAFSADGKRLLLGTSGIVANLRCFDSATGAEEWSYGMSSEIGEGERSPMTWPETRGIVVDSENRAFVAADRTWFEHKEVEGIPEQFTHFNTKLYCFDMASGEKLWVYPEEETLDQPARGLEASADGKYVLFSGGIVTPDAYQEGVVFCLDGESGAELWRYSLPVMYPTAIAEHHYTGVFITGFISPDGEYVTMIDHDARVFMFDMAEMITTEGKAEPLWEKDLSLPLVDGLCIVYTGGETIEYTGEGILLANNVFTYAPGHEGVELRPLPTIEHPYANCFFQYDLDGTLLSRYRLEGYCPNTRVAVSENGRYLVAPMGQVYIPDNLLSAVPRSPETHGLCVFDLEREGCWSEKLDWFYHTEGPVVGVEVTSDGKYLVAYEVPVDMDPDAEVEEVVGSYKVHFLN